MRACSASRSHSPAGLQFLTSYAFSKILTDADGYWPGGAAMDPYNRKLEKSIGQFDITQSEGQRCRGPARWQREYKPKFRAFPNYNENFSLAKTSPVRERERLDFRAEMFNAFNRVRFGQESLTIQSQTFGILSQTAGDQINSPRQMQLALKLCF